LAQDISKESYNFKNVTKVKSLRIALTNARVASSSRDWSNNFGLPAGRILPTISRMAAILSLQVSNSTPNETQKATPFNQSMSQRPHCEMSSVGLPRHPAVAYLFLVKC